MSPRSKKEYIEAVFLRYKKADRSQKKVILDEFCRTLGYHRKHAIRVLRGFKRFTAPRPRRRGRHPQYQREDIFKPLKQIWLAANLPCSKRLKAIRSLLRRNCLRGIPWALRGLCDCHGYGDWGIRPAVAVLPRAEETPISKFQTVCLLGFGYICNLEFEI